MTGTEATGAGSSEKSWSNHTDYLKDEEKNIADQYASDSEYAKKQQEEAYKKAEDMYGIAVRDANANFKTNQPTYGATAERLLASGLTGSGYSDYLAGKA